MHRVARYTRAIEWMAVNDDTDWTADAETVLSVTAPLAVDLSSRGDDQVLADLRREMEKQHGAGGH